MQFDHTGNNKTGVIARIMLNNNIRKLLDEIRKCDLVCANCHADRTHKRAGLMLVD